MQALSINAGETITYEIEWGKKRYFGWQENINIEHKFKDLYFPTNYSGGIRDYYLNNNLHFWYLAYGHL